jgi:hypothetical protein
MPAYNENTHRGGHKSSLDKVYTMYGDKNAFDDASTIDNFCSVSNVGAAKRMSNRSNGHRGNGNGNYRIGANESGNYRNGNSSRGATQQTGSGNQGTLGGYRGHEQYTRGEDALAERYREYEHEDKHQGRIHKKKPGTFDEPGPYLGKRNPFEVSPKRTFSPIRGSRNSGVSGNNLSSVNGIGGSSGYNGNDMSDVPLMHNGKPLQGAFRVTKEQDDRMSQLQLRFRPNSAKSKLIRDEREQKKAKSENGGNRRKKMASRSTNNFGGMGEQWDGAGTGEKYD